MAVKKYLNDFASETGRSAFTIAFGLGLITQNFVQCTYRAFHSRRNHRFLLSKRGEQDFTIVQCPQVLIESGKRGGGRRQLFHERLISFQFWWKFPIMVVHSRRQIEFLALHTTGQWA